MTEYGCTRTFGDRTYSVEGCHSAEDALHNVYRRAFEHGDWKPRKLRQKWWQVWRPKEHRDIEKMFTGETT